MNFVLLTILGAGQLVQQGGVQKEISQTQSFQRFQQTSGKVSYANGHSVEEVGFKKELINYLLFSVPYLGYIIIHVFYKTVCSVKMFKL